MLGLAICLISTIGLTAGISLIRGREQPRAPWIFLALFLIDGAVNGWIWFGHPILSGQIANVTVSVIIGAMLLIGRSQQQT